MCTKETFEWSVLNVIIKDFREHQKRCFERVSHFYRVLTLYVRYVNVVDGSICLTRISLDL